MAHDGRGGPAADPHIWLDPVKYAEVAKGVGKSLEKADPDHAADYRTNTDALVKKLDALNTVVQGRAWRTPPPRPSSPPTPPSATSPSATASTRRASPASTPSPSRAPPGSRTSRTIAEKDKVTTVFFETLASDKTAKTVARDTGLKTDVLDPLEGITDKSKGDDYIEVMQSNLAALQKALGAK